MFELGKVTFGLSQTNIVFQTNACTPNRKAALLTPKTKDCELSLALAPLYVAKE